MDNDKLLKLIDLTRDINSELSSHLDDEWGSCPILRRVGDELVLLEKEIKGDNVVKEGQKHSLTVHDVVAQNIVLSNRNEALISQIDWYEREVWKAMVHPCDSCRASCASPHVSCPVIVEHLSKKSRYLHRKEKFLKENFIGQEEGR